MNRSAHTARASDVFESRRPGRLLAAAAGVVLASMVALVLPPTASASPANATLWRKRYNGPGSSNDDAYSVAVSPDGSKVFVTGSSTGSGTSGDYATIAYDAASGVRAWSRRYHGPGNEDDTASSVVTDGTRVYVTGKSLGTSGYDYATIAYEA